MKKSLVLFLAAALVAGSASAVALDVTQNAGLEIEPNGLAQHMGMEMDPNGLAQTLGMEMDPNGLTR